MATTPDELVAAPRQAIADATAFDARDINCSFDYDHEAYGEVNRNLRRSVASGQSRLAMEPGLDLMTRGSPQVGMSDEGPMAEDIESCLSVVIKAIAKRDLPAEEVLAYCSAMLVTDPDGFIARAPLQHCAVTSGRPRHNNPPYASPAANGHRFAVPAIRSHSGKMRSPPEHPFGSRPARHEADSFHTPAESTRSTERARARRATMRGETHDVNSSRSALCYSFPFVHDAEWVKSAVPFA
jgi:hypothetical protein